MDMFALRTLDTPFGPLTVVAGDAGVRRVLFRGALIDDRPGSGVAARHATQAVGEIGEYLAGERQVFEVSLDVPEPVTFTQRAQAALRGIPFGKTVSYAELAELAGNARAFRAAGSACASNPLPVLVPCHRVLASGGAIGGFAGGLTFKRGLLELEGMRF
ncbi:methylated-DNA--[protein]-cysteine S-methyltransferase [Corynebacterium sp. CCM 9204]|uniref:methylated-DNA--[protein]-cysteine S-methyltransferase n=1 Tax=Corynebacterium sp. CCM 9204 TaxID=3057616 RepID=UPI00352330CB